MRISRFRRAQLLELVNPWQVAFVKRQASLLHLDKKKQAPGMTLLNFFTL